MCFDRIIGTPRLVPLYRACVVFLLYVFVHMLLGASAATRL